MEEPPADTPVLIAGGGPSGLSASIELGTRGVENVVVEPRTHVSHTAPRAKLTNVRTMEHFRRWGIGDRLREAAHIPVDWSSDVVFCRTLLGEEIARFTEAFGAVAGRPDRYAEQPQQVPQYIVEEVLRERVEATEASTLLAGWRVDDLRQDGDGVETTVTACVEGLDVSAGTSRWVRSAYLLGCDGAGSTVRKAIGAEATGSAPPGTNLGVVFSAPDLADRHPHGPAVHYWVVDEGVQGFLGPLDLDDRWWAIVIDVDDPADPDPAELLATMIGGPVDLTVRSTDPWSPRVMLVSEPRDGRVFLVGDAAHLNPPFGGHGFNTGVGDAVDVGWKLAAVLDGWGGPALLDAYAAERRGVQEAVIDVATENMEASAASLVSFLPDAATAESADESYAALARRIYETKKVEFHSLGLVLGERYTDSPIVAGAGESSPERSATEFEPRSLPGTRLPHAWLDDGSAVFDHLGPAFTLLRLDPALDVGALGAAAETLGVPMATRTLDPGRLSREYEAPLLLVRPDQHVAWRGDRPPEDPEALLERVCGR